MPLRLPLPVPLRLPLPLPLPVRTSYLDGEDPDAALLRLFQRNRQVLGRTDDDVIAAMIPFALAHERASGHGGGR